MAALARTNAIPTDANLMYSSGTLRWNLSASSCVVQVSRYARVIEIAASSSLGKLTGLNARRTLSSVRARIYENRSRNPILLRARSKYNMLCIIFFFRGQIVKRNLFDIRYNILSRHFRLLGQLVLFDSQIFINFSFFFQLRNQVNMIYKWGYTVSLAALVVSIFIFFYFR